MLAKCCNTLLRRYSLFLYNYPYVFLILTPIFLVICVIFSFVPPVGPDFPDFSEPTLGFEPRGMEIMKRVVTQQDTLKAAIKANELTCTPSLQTSKTKRNKRSNPETFLLCHSDVYRYSSVVTIYESGGDLFNLDDLKTICLMEESIVRSTPGFHSLCSCRLPPLYDKCGPALSLGSYIASIRNRSSCHAITPQDVTYAKNLLQNCSSAFLSGQLENNKGPTECIQNRVKDVFDLMVDIDYMRNGKKILKSAMVLSPFRYYDTDFARDIYDQHISGNRPERHGVELVAFKFGDFKFDQFNLRLLTDAIFPAIGLIIVAVILLIYTNSLLVMGLTVFSIIASIIVAYFIYHQVFRLAFFPFLNILTFVFLVGIGADDAFVFSDVWLQAKLAIPNGSITDWIEYTLSHAVLSMFVTSFTTAAAFYANIVSDITAIRLFGIFAGTSILILFSLMITWFPAGVVFMEKRRHSRNISAGSTEFIENTVVIETKHPSGGGGTDLENMELQENPAVKTSQPPDGDVSPTQSDHGSSANVIGHSSETDYIDYSSRQVTQNSTPVCICCVCCPCCTPICAWFIAVRSKCGKIMLDLFQKWIPTALRGYPIWLIALLALGIGMACAVTVSPGLQRPKSSEFQVFANSHILEQYDLKYRNKFRLESTAQNNFWVYIYFGFKAEDNGNYLEPKNFGELKYDDDFNAVLPEVQKWLMESLCSDIRKQKFFGKNIRWECFPEELKKACTAGKNDSFPFNETQLENCIQNHYSSSHPTCTEYSSGLFFRGNKVAGINLAFPTNIPYTTEYSIADELWQDIKDFSSVLEGAPDGIKNGWAISWLRFYALQSNLGSSTITSLGVSLAIAFCVMLLTSLNWVISIYAIVTIICILATTIGSLVLDGWELNILESIVISVAVGLSVDFTLHYGVAYTISSENGRVNQVKYALGHIGPAVTLAAVTTFIAGVFMMFSTVLAYFQLGQFLTLVMAFSWLFATFFFMSLCYFAGPVGHFGQINSTKCGSCKVSHEP